MALRYPYTDAYLANLITQPREDKAFAFVAELGTLPAFWIEELTRLKAYCITCEESQKAPEDLFAAKLASYRKAFSEALTQARAAQDAVNAAAGAGPSGGASVFTMSLERC